MWDHAWAEFVPFLAFDPEIRRVICSTNAIEIVNARTRRAMKARGHFPNEQAAQPGPHAASARAEWRSGLVRRRRRGAAASAA
ncbi:hypothetical protein GCM10017566_45500 [Amycolatopsis bartoniae]|uniref:Mutator family transposase n=1 Tax=Amycolatopsis bartoniae TaxID=941986 RepID=A0A8H9M6M3_9PSEU|nr:hypothetical protein GCM10017566_45500 [Amycolatopsis bartoniae]